nr:uncharacterized protein LOC109156749 [Ipomoea batatas]
MDNSNAVSAQRSYEDSDLLERSTRKRKVDDGTSEIAMSVPVETHPREEIVVPPSSAEVDGGALTLVEDPLASAMQIEDVRDEQQSAAADPGSGTPLPSPIANAMPRSYLDSVVGSGSGAAPFLLTSLPEDEVEDSMGDDAGTGDGVAEFGACAEVDDQDAAVSPNANPAVGTRGGTAIARRSKPYGSWMIVTRKDHRQTGRPSGSKEEAGTGLPPLLEQSERRADKQPAVSGSDVARQPSRTRRANVIVNERQIENERATAQVPRRQSRGSGSRRAAEEDEHVVIRGEMGGQVINSARVANEEGPTANTEESEAQSQEHHTDPPDDFDMEGDVVMEIEDPNGENLTEGGIWEMGIDSSTSPVTDGPLRSFEAKAKAVNNLTEFQARSHSQVSPLLNHSRSRRSKSLPHWFCVSPLRQFLARSCLNSHVAATTLDLGDGHRLPFPLSSCDRLFRYAPSWQRPKPVDNLNRKFSAAPLSSSRLCSITPGKSPLTSQYLALYRSCEISI